MKRRAVSLASEGLVEFGPLRDDWRIPRVARPGGAMLDAEAWAASNREVIQAELRAHGALLFRGFGIDSVTKLRAFSAAISPDLVEYIERRSPRTELGDKVYTSTIHPADQYIHFHNT